MFFRLANKISLYKANFVNIFHQYVNQKTISSKSIILSNKSIAFSVSKLL